MSDVRHGIIRLAVLDAVDCVRSSPGVPMTRRAKAPESARALVAGLRRFRRDYGDWPGVGSDDITKLLNEIRRLRRLLRAAAGKRTYTRSSLGLSRRAAAGKREAKR
jgi:hypothetical protein